MRERREGVGRWERIRERSWGVQSRTRCGGGVKGDVLRRGGRRGGLFLVLALWMKFGERIKRSDGASYQVKG